MQKISISCTQQEIIPQAEETITRYQETRLTCAKMGAENLYLLGILGELCVCFPEFSFASE